MAKNKPHALSEATPPEEVTERAQERNTTVLIKGIAFKIKAPYFAGHVMTAGEAAALNQTYLENIRNNYGKKVEKVKGDAATLGDEDHAKLAAELMAYEDEYSFDSAPKASRGPRASVDPVEAQAYKNAAVTVESLLNAQGIKKNQITSDNFKRLVEDVLAKRPEIREQARRQVEVLASVATAHLAEGGIDVSSLERVEAKASAAPEAEVADAAK